MGYIFKTSEEYAAMNAEELRSELIAAIYSLSEFERAQFWQELRKEGIIKVQT